jgi:FKBP-type peptidyl-prolyl cis-trans isomerase SlyD
MKQTIDKFKVVSITYRIVDEWGELVEQSDVPVDYIHGVENAMFPKVEAALTGKEIGDSVEVMLPPEEGFGYPDKKLIFTDHLENAPPEYRFVGAKPTFQNEHGETLEMTVTKIENDMITVDGNHPFAGQTMTFFVTVAGIRDVSEAEIGGGVAQMPGPATLQ